MSQLFTITTQPSRPTTMNIKAILLAFLLITCAELRAGIVYSGVQNVPIPLDFSGVFLRIDTGAVSTSLPADFQTAPWINAFFGGTGIGTGPLLRPIITGTDQVLNVAANTLIGPGGGFASGTNGSSSHVGTGAGQFLLNTPGYIGVAFRTTTAAPDSYGWLNVELRNNAPGRIISWAFENQPGQAIRAGAIPEPTTALFGLALTTTVLTGRRRGRSA